jgi:hypothetical protein
MCLVLLQVILEPNVPPPSAVRAAIEALNATALERFVRRLAHPAARPT